MNEEKKLAIAAFVMALAIVIGAFGSHVLQSGLTDKYIRTLTTANSYYMIHGLAMFVIALQMIKNPMKFLSSAYSLFLIGIVFFSGSLYVIVLSKFLEFDLPFFIGPMTPIGGMFFIIGWCVLGVGYLRSSAS